MAKARLHCGGRANAGARHWGEYSDFQRRECGAVAGLAFQPAGAVGADRFRARQQGVMTNPDPRCQPLIELEFEQIRALLAPVLQDAVIVSIERVTGGLVNTLYRVTVTSGVVC